MVAKDKFIKDLAGEVFENVIKPAAKKITGDAKPKVKKPTTKPAPVKVEVAPAPKTVVEAALPKVAKPTTKTAVKEPVEGMDKFNQKFFDETNALEESRAALVKLQIQQKAIKEAEDIAAATARAEKEAKDAADKITKDAEDAAKLKDSEAKVAEDIAKRAATKKAAEDEVIRLQEEALAKTAARKESLKNVAKGTLLPIIPIGTQQVLEESGVVREGTFPSRILTALSLAGTIYGGTKIGKATGGNLKNINTARNKDVSFLNKAKAGTKSAVALTAAGIPTGILTKKLFSGKPEEPIVEEAPEGQAEFVQTVNEAAAQDNAVADSNYNAKITSVVNANGGAQATVDKVNAGDPLLTAQLESIQQEYEVAKEEIKANYAAAMEQIKGYQTQATGILSDVAKAQAADFERASGGLQAMQAPTGMSTEEASAIGLSPESVGGGGITGAALARGLGASSASQLAAEQVNLGTTLGDQLATGAIDQADYLNMLALSRLQAKNTAKENKLARDIAAQQDALNFQQDLAKMRYAASLSNQGSSSNTAFKDSSPAARGTQIGYPKNASLESKQLIDTINAEIATNPKVTDKNPAVAAAAWSKFYGEISAGYAKATKGSTPPAGSSPFDKLQALGIPTTAQEMVSKLGISK